MPKLRFAMLHIMPLCLKFRGRLVGAVSRSRVGIYIGAGLLMLSSLLLLIVLISTEYHPETLVQPKEQQIEEQIEQQVSAPAPQQTDILPQLSQATPQKETSVISQSLKGPIQVDFGWESHPVYKDWRYHTGIDIRGSIGQAVEAIDKGQVVAILTDPQSGLTVVVKNNTSMIYYGSLSEVTVTKESDVRPGERIGIMGTCDAEPYPHLHLAIKKDEEYIDPKLIINAD